MIAIFGQSSIDTAANLSVRAGQALWEELPTLIIGYGLGMLIVYWIGSWIVKRVDVTEKEPTEAEKKKEARFRRPFIKKVVDTVIETFGGDVDIPGVYRLQKIGGSADDNKTHSDKPTESDLAQLKQLQREMLGSDTAADSIYVRTLQFRPVHAQSKPGALSNYVLSPSAMVYNSHSHELVFGAKEKNIIRVINLTTRMYRVLLSSCAV